MDVKKKLGNRSARRQARTVFTEGPRESSAKSEAFTFGDPIPVMQRSDILDYAECWSTGEWYEPPISWPGLAKTFRAGVHHASAIYFKRNMLVSNFTPHRLLSREDFGKWILDFLIFGNGYLDIQRNRLGGLLALKHIPAKSVRRAADRKRYVLLNGVSVSHTFDEGTVAHVMAPDINQELYGLPEYLGALHAAWLNESATLFRRRYYENGSHAGFILYMTDAAQKQEDVDMLRDALRNAKGPGNFRNLFMYAPNGKKDGIQILPVSEVTAKDEFFNIKNVTRDDLLAAHRVPPQLLGIVPSNSGGFGTPDTAAGVFERIEIMPLQVRLAQVNDLLGVEAVSFAKAGF
ncbi:PBSX family phage portal protein [Robbsia andropogonis]|uniref:phage portal protein n=1 Tax=Robbsia andropogonis TaxID=28092 RepID=UPI003D25D5CE